MMFGTSDYVTNDIGDPRRQQAAQMAFGQGPAQAARMAFGPSAGGQPMAGQAPQAFQPGPQQDPEHAAFSSRLGGLARAQGLNVQWMPTAGAGGGYWRGVGDSPQAQAQWAQLTRAAQTMGSADAMMAQTPGAQAQAFGQPQAMQGDQQRRMGFGQAEVPQMGQPQAMGGQPQQMQGYEQQMRMSHANQPQAQFGGYGDPRLAQRRMAFKAFGSG